MQISKYPNIHIPTVNLFTSVLLSGIRLEFNRTHPHVEDWVGVAKFLMDNPSVDGPVNLASPNPVTNAFFMREMRKSFAPLGIGLPAPSLFVQIGAFFMRTAPELVLKSRKVVSSTLTEAGYSFKYPDLAQAVSNLAS